MGPHRAGGAPGGVGEPGARDLEDHHRLHWPLPHQQVRASLIFYSSRGLGTAQPCCGHRQRSALHSCMRWGVLLAAALTPPIYLPPRMQGPRRGGAAGSGGAGLGRAGRLCPDPPPAAPAQKASVGWATLPGCVRERSGRERRGEVETSRAVERGPAVLAALQRRHPTPRPTPCLPWLLPLAPLQPWCTAS